ncbi:unnamed protein product [Rotaria magnacalcarata]
MIQQAMSIACQHMQDEYKAKFILKSYANTLAENKSIFNWLYEKFTQLNLRYPWNLIGQQLDEKNNKLFLIQYTVQLISNNLWILLIIILFVALLIFFMISSIKTFCKYKRNQRMIEKRSLWNQRFPQKKSHIYSRSINTFQSIINNNYYSKEPRSAYILFKCIYSIFFICILLTSCLLMWMIILLLQGITIERKIHDYIEKASLELISFIDHTASKTNCFINSIQINDDTLTNNGTLSINFQLKFALKGVSFLRNILHDLSIRLTNLEKLFHSWFIIRLLAIACTIVCLSLCGFVIYLIFKKLHCSHLKSFKYANITFILSIVYWIGFVVWFTKCILLLPRVAGACSTCNDLKEQQVYTSLLFASKWFNSTFLIAMNNHSIDIDQLIEKCKENSLLWSVNYFIRLGLLDNNVDQNVSRDKMNMEHLDVDEYYPGYSKYEQRFVHCQILHELHQNFVQLFCHTFVKHLLNYLTASIITAIGHFLLYLITIRLRRCIQKHNYQHKHFHFSFQSSPILTRHHSIILPWYQNKQDDIERTEYENQVQ